MPPPVLSDELPPPPARGRPNPPGPSRPSRPNSTIAPARPTPSRSPLPPTSSSSSDRPSIPRYCITFSTHLIHLHPLSLPPGGHQPHPELQPVAQLRLLHGPRSHKDHIRPHPPIIIWMCIIYRTDVIIIL